MRSHESIRVIIWPRNPEFDYHSTQAATSSNNFLNISAIEMAGKIFVGDREFFENRCDSEILGKSFKNVQLSDEKWTELLLTTERLFN